MSKPDVSSQESQIDFSTVLASSVHDMKNSIGMLLASLETLFSEQPPTNPDEQRRYNILHYEASRINGELIQLLTLYRMSNRFLPVRIDEHYVVDVLEEQIARNQFLFDTAEIDVQMDCDNNLRWYYDQDLVGSVIHNVLINCARYTESKLLVKAEMRDHYCVFTLADDGSGYPDDMLVHEMQESPAPGSPSRELSEQIPSVGKWSIPQGSAINSREGRTHLGLFFAENIAARHKQGRRRGFITIDNDSPLGGGQFKLWLP